MQTILPQPGYLFLEAPEQKSQTKSGLYLGTAAEDSPSVAKIINSSAESRLKADDWVFYKQYSAHPIKLNDTEYLLVAEEDILGVILDVKEK